MAAAAANALAGTCTAPTTAIPNSCTVVGNCCVNLSESSSILTPRANYLCVPEFTKVGGQIACGTNTACKV